MASSPATSSFAPGEGAAAGTARKPDPGPRLEARPPPSHDQPLPEGDRNENPPELGLLALVAEDYRTHDRKLLEPGFVAIAVHRFGNARMGVRPALLRAPLTLLYRLMFTLVNWLWGIDLSYTVRLGRRVRIWHHGGMVLGARAIGDDVHIRHNTTFGVLNRRELQGKPIIGNRVDIGVGACILGAVTVGDDSVIGPNSVVLRDLPPGSVVMGIPARQAVLRMDGGSPPSGPAA
jgi:serine O-acetyltransferase